MSDIFILSKDKLTSVGPLGESVDELWNILQYIKSVANLAHTQSESVHSVLEQEIGAIKANSLLSCLNLIFVMAEEAQSIIESKVESQIS